MLATAAREGQAVSLYTTLSIEDVEPVTSAFTDEYGIEVDVYRALGPDVAARASNELRAGRPGFGVIWSNGQVMTSLEQEDAFTSFASSHVDGIPEDLITSEVWLPTDVNYWSWAFNPNALNESQIPRNYESLADSKWRGKITLARYTDWFATLWNHMGDARARRFFSALAANDPFITRPSFTLAQQFVYTGEFPLTISTTSSIAHRESSSGVPIRGYFPNQPTVARPNGAAWNMEGPNPAGGLLLAEFLLDPDGGQGRLAEIGRIPAHNSVSIDPPSLRASKFVTVDFESFLANQTMWEERWEDIFGSEVHDG